jgi:hypothetical protein
MKILYYFLSIVSLCTFFCMQCAVDCMDNSRHVSSWFDHKDYQLVYNVRDGHKYPCACPCEPHYLVISDRGKCTQCGHYRDVRNWIVVGPRHTHLAAKQTCPAQSAESCKKKSPFNYLLYTTK